MKGWLSLFGLGLGLALGAGLIYVFIVNETAWIIFLALAMFVLGGMVMTLALLFLNRQWTRAVFGDGQPPRISHNYRMTPPSQPSIPPYNSQGYLPEPQSDPYAFQIVEQQTSNTLTDDSPMA